MIRALIDSLNELCMHNPRVIVLVADDKEIYDFLYEQYPDRVINIGISECNAISVAAGLSSGGYIPYVIGGNTFMAYRAYEFVRDQLCMQNRNVKVIGIGAGVAISVLGNTQHATEDVGALRVLPGLMIMTPATPIEVNRMVMQSINIQSPLFMRVGRACGKDFYQEGFEFEPYKVQEIKRGKDIAIFSTGSIVCDALKVAEQLKDKGLDIGVINIHTIKPLDIMGIKVLSNTYSKWISVEEHNVIGGLGSILAEVIVEEKLKVSLKKLGLMDTFAKGYGTYSDIKKANGLDINDIMQMCSFS